MALPSKSNSVALSTCRNDAENGLHSCRDGVCLRSRTAHGRVTIWADVVGVAGKAGAGTRGSPYWHMAPRRL